VAGRTTWIQKLWKARDESLRSIIVEALEDARGVQQRAARLLGISRRQLLRYLWRERLWEELDRIRIEARRRRYEERAPTWTSK
jgi:transcriptional regulator with GAF, ATPase, and Fis domain